MPSPGKKKKTTLPNHVISDLHAPGYFRDFALQVNKAFTALIKQTVPAAAVGAARGSDSSGCSACSALLCLTQEEKVHLSAAEISARKRFPSTI